jgi:hypothetical protein
MYEGLDKLSGRTRDVYVDGDWVYKVPRTVDGYLANQTEAQHYQFNLEHPDEVYIPIAPCELTPKGILRMRRVEPFSDLLCKLPGWVLSVDCAQVGYLGDQLVAYDL